VVGAERHAPAALPPEKTRYPLYRRLGGPQDQSGRVRKITPPTGIRSPDRPTRSESLYRLSYPGPYKEDIGRPMCTVEGSCRHADDGRDGVTLRWRIVRILVNKTMDSWAQRQHGYRKRVASVALTEQMRLSRQVESLTALQLDVTQFAFASSAPPNENTTVGYL
jgi:hypothetical protein